MDFGPKTAPFLKDALSLLAPFSATFSDIDFWMHFDRHLAPLWALLAPFWSPLVAFGVILDPFWPPLVDLCVTFATF